MAEDEKVVVTEEAVSADPQERVDVTPAPKLSEEDQLVAKIKADVEALNGSRIQQLEQSNRNQQQALQRIQAERDELRAKLSTSIRPTPAPSDQDLWNGIENGSKWKEQIEKVAEQKAEEKLKAYQAQQTTQQLLTKQYSILEESKQKVIGKYADLDPETGNPDSPVSKAYVKVLTAHPEWTTNPYGPVLAMYEMEEQLKAAVPQTSPAAPKRGSMTTLPAARNGAPTPSRITLTREQKEFCDRHQLKYEDFVKTAAALDTGAVEA